MTAFDPIKALALPAGALVDRRVPKTLLIDNTEEQEVPKFAGNLLRCKHIALQTSA